MEVLLRLKEIDFPKELFAAQQDGSLVIFVGAGISMGEPSNLPSFLGLVSQIAKGTRFEKVVPPLDKALGDMEKGRIEVKRLAKQILANPNSKPTPTHQLLLELASKNKNGVRIVTTNLDSHFSVSAKSLGLELEEYFAPALPLGSDFNGIVYLHGTVLKPESRYVLTDGDFGKAYLIDGWATRFVKEMFLKYTVLFVGYSHDDTVMNYISRGMPPTMPGKRFALAPNENDGKWDGLGISLIEFPLKEGTDRYIALSEGLGEWLRHVSMGVLDHEKQIQQLVSQRPPIDQRDIDYLLDCISDKDTRPFFMKHAQTPEWIAWTDSQGLLKDLFSLSANLDLMGKQLSYWLAGTFLRKYPYHLLSLIEEKKNVLHPELWTSIAFGLHGKSDVEMDRKAFRIFVSLLLRRTHEIEGRNALDYLLEDCKTPDDDEAALALLIHLTKPFIELEKRVYVAEEDKDNFEKILDADLGINGEAYWLTKNWDRIFRKKLSQFGERLFFAFKEHIETGYDLIRAFEQDPRFDSISYQRSAVERHGQNRRLANDFPNLLDCFSDVLEWAALENKDLTQVGLSWIKSPRFLLRRFAVFVMHRSKFHSSDEKCSWLIEQDIIFSYHTHHEVYGLLKEIYPTVSSENRKHLVSQILKGPQTTEDKEDRKEWEQYSTFQVLAWLHAADKNCDLIKDELDKIKFANPTYVQREHADLHGYVTDAVWVGSETPHSPDDLIKMNLEPNLQSLLTWTSESRFGIEGGRSGLIDAVEKGIEKEPAFGFRLSDVLSKSKNWETDLWDGVIRGWTKASLNENEIDTIVKFLLGHQELHKLTYEIADLLLSLVSKKEPRLPESSYNDAMSLAESLWVVGKDIRKDRDDVNDWLTAAINHHGGRLAEFWLHLLSQCNVSAGTAQFPERIKNALELFLSDDSYQGKLARVIIASQSFFLFSCSQEWAIKNVVPLLDIDVNEDEAHRAWDGYLSWGKWSDEFLQHIRPLFQKIFKKISVVEGNEDRFVEYVAGICLYASDQPNQNNWLSDFLTSSEPKIRVLFSKKLQWMFRNMKADVRSMVWKKWIKDYWINREDGRPLRFDNEEKEDMIELAVLLDEDLSEAVELIISSVAPVVAPLGHTMIFHMLNEDDVGDKHPESTLKLLLHLMPVFGDQAWWCGELETLAKTLITKLGGRQVHRADLIKLCDLLGQKHCPNAGALRDSIPTN